MYLKRRDIWWRLRERAGGTQNSKSLKPRMIRERRGWITSTQLTDKEPTGTDRSARPMNLRRRDISRGLPGKFGSDGVSSSGIIDFVLTIKQNKSLLLQMCLLKALS